MTKNTIQPKKITKTNVKISFQLHQLYQNDLIKSKQIKTRQLPSGKNNLQSIMLMPNVIHDDLWI